MSRELFLAAFLVSVTLVPLAAAQDDAFLTDPNPANDEWMEMTLLVEQPDLRTLEVQGTILLRKYAIEGTDYRTADDLGAAYQQFLQVDEFARANGQESDRAAGFIADLEVNTTRTLREALEAGYPGAEVTIEPAALDVDTLGAPEGDPYAPGVKLEIRATVKRTAEQVGTGTLSDAAIGAGFAMGARISSTATLTVAAGHDVTYMLAPPALPEGIAFVEASPAAAATVTDGTLVVPIDNSAGTTTRRVEVTAVVANPSARVYTQEEIDAGSAVNAVVDLQDIDIEIGKAIGGDFGNLVGEVRITADLSVIALPAELSGALPASVQIATLTSNGIRILLAEGAITDAQVADLEKTFVTQVETNLKNALQTSVTVTGGLAAGTLDGAGIEDVNGGAPIRLEATASFVKSLSGAPAPEAAIALYTQTQSFDLPRVDGMPTTYKVILPPGLALASIDVTGGEKTSGSEGGRDWFTVSPTGGSATATAAMAITPAFIFAKFLPIVLLAVLLIILIIGTPIALVMRSRKKKSD